LSVEGKSPEPVESRNGIAILRWIERAGNLLPDPGTLFIILLFVVLILSQIGHSFGWAVQSEIVRDGQLVSETVRPRPLLTSDGIYWLISSVIKNFVEFPPLGIVLVGMMGVGVCERVGLIDALLKVMVRVTPKNVLTPTVVFIGVMSSIGSDSGYVVLPPIVAALFASVGRSPVVGIAAVFAGIAGGFGANLLITGGDAVLAGLTTTAAQLVEPGYQVAATSNWYFSIASVGLLTITGWLVTRFLVEPNYRSRPPELGGPVAVRDTASNFQMTSGESTGLFAAGVTFAIVLTLVLCAILIPGAPLHGMGRAATVGAPATSDSLRWVNSIVPLLFLCFVLPGIAFGIATGKIRSEKDVFKIMGASVATLSPIIVLAFFASQFISSFA
jgi:aminobenzoyl-glutamate transport protein